MSPGGGSPGGRSPAASLRFASLRPALPCRRVPPPRPVLGAAGPHRSQTRSHAAPRRSIHKLRPPHLLPRARSRAPPTIHTARPAPFINNAPAPDRTAPRRQAPHTRPGRRELGPGLGLGRGGAREGAAATAARPGTALRSAPAPPPRTSGLRCAPPRAACLPSASANGKPPLGRPRLLIGCSAARRPPARRSAEHH